MKNFKEITLPAGTFRQYDDNPFVWVQVVGVPVIKRIEDNFNAGNIKKN